MKKLIVANWKMLPATLAEAEDIVAKIDECLQGSPSAADLVICPPFVFIEEMAKRLGEGKLAEVASLGAQDISLSDEPGQTGEVSGIQLEKLGVRYVIVGHSERRWKLGESDETVNRKLKTALRHGFTSIVCLGERTREGNWKEELSAQTLATFRGVTSGELAKCIIAYEPVWAISTNPNARPDTPESAIESITLIRDILATSLPTGQAGYKLQATSFLYGGSVTPDNAKSFLSRPEISGLLIGGASVRAKEFCEILAAATSLPR